MSKKRGSKKQRKGGFVPNKYTDKVKKTLSLKERRDEAIARNAKKSAKKVVQVSHAGFVKQINGATPLANEYSPLEYMKKDCHQLMSPFSIGKCKIYLGSIFSIREHEFSKGGGWSLIINMAGYEVFRDGPVNSNDSARHFLPEYLTLSKRISPELRVDWPDGGVPRDIPLKWFFSLAQYLATLEGNVGICCIGGHGRTGTLAVILAGLSGLIPENDCPVEWLRKKYCDEIVESDSQIRLIEKVLGRSVTAEPGMEAYGLWAEYYGGQTEHGPKITKITNNGHTSITLSDPDKIDMNFTQGANVGRMEEPDINDYSEDEYDFYEADLAQYYAVKDSEAYSEEYIDDPDAVYTSDLGPYGMRYNADGDPLDADGYPLDTSGWVEELTD